jgi:hypothetical protein
MGAMGMSAASGLQGISSLGGGIAQSRAIKAQGEYQAKMLELNAKLAEFQAGESIRIGERTAEDYQEKVRGLLGAQRVAIAAANIQLGEGSAAKIQEDTAAQAASEVITIRGNAWREAWGYRVHATDLRGQAAFTRVASRFEADQALWGGAMEGLSSFAKAGAYAGQAWREDSKDRRAAGRESARTYFDDPVPEVSMRGRGPGRWGRDSSGNHNYGYQKVWG